MEPEGDSIIVASPFADPWLSLDISAARQNDIDLPGQGKTLTFKIKHRLDIFDTILKGRFKRR